LVGALAAWDPEDQLLFYFSGHGDLRHGSFCLGFGEKGCLLFPFESVTAELRVAGVTRAILILDACHAGAALRGWRKKKPTDDSFPFPEGLPRGIAIIASCAEHELSCEKEGGSESVFTALFCEGIETGLGGLPTADGYIGVDDVVDFVRKRLDDEKCSDRHSVSQTPRFGVEEADRTIWIAKNKSGSISRRPVRPSVYSVESLKDLIELCRISPHAKRPCIGATMDDLDWDLIRDYARKVDKRLSMERGDEKALRELGFFVDGLEGSPPVLHNSAVLCFTRRPERYIPHATATFVLGNLTRDDTAPREVHGPLSAQVEQLFDWTIQQLGLPTSIGDTALRREREEIPTPVVRELIANAIAHRDYQVPGKVQVRITGEELQVLSPGGFPAGTSWDQFLTGLTSSRPIDPWIALYLNRLEAAEGVGRGFALFREYLSANGPESLRCEIIAPGPTLCVRVKRHRLPESARVIAEKPSPPAGPGSDTAGPAILPATRDTVDGEPRRATGSPTPSACLREIVSRHRECAWLFDEAERLSKALFEPGHERTLMPFFTDHGPAHCKKVEEILDTVLFPATLDPSDPRVFYPNPEEAMYLLSAAWLHDIGMIYGIFPNETEVLEGKDVPWEKNREGYELRSAQFIRTNWRIACDWREPEKLLLAEICVYHRHRYPLSDIVPVVRGRTGEPVRIRDLAALLRLADVCHVDASRAPADMKNLFRSFGMPVPAKEHWGLFSFVHEIRFDHDAKKIHAHSYIPEPKQYGTASVDFTPIVKRLAKAIEDGLISVTPYLSAYSNTDFRGLETRITRPMTMRDPEEFLRRTWPCMLSSATSGSEAACMVAAALLALLPGVGDLPRREIMMVLTEAEHLHPYNFLVRRLVADVPAVLKQDSALGETGSSDQAVSLRKYLVEFLDERQASRLRAGAATRRRIDPDDTLVVYGDSGLFMHVLCGQVKGHRGTVLIVKPHPPCGCLTNQDEEERIFAAFRESRMSYRVVEMAALPEVFSYLQERRVSTKVLLTAHGLLNRGDVLATMGSSMIAAAARSSGIPVLVVTEVSEIGDGPPTDAEVEHWLTEQAVALTAISFADQASALLDPIDVLDRAMYDWLVGAKDDVNRQGDSEGIGQRHGRGIQ